MKESYHCIIGERNFSLSLNEWAPQTNASVVLRSETALILCTVVMGGENAQQDFFPLTVEYRERAASAGRIPGNIGRRELRASDEETLSARIIDRSIRPLFPKDFKRETVVTVMVFSADKDLDLPTAALNAVSLALLCSDIPWDGPVVGLRLCRHAGDLRVFPRGELQSQADMDFVVSVGKTGILMVEGGAKQLSEDDVLAGLEFCEKTAQPLIVSQLEFAKKYAKEKILIPKAETDPDALLELLKESRARMAQALQVSDKQDRKVALEMEKASFLDLIKEKSALLMHTFEQSHWSQIFDDSVRDEARLMILNNTRFDKRRRNEVRALSCKTSVLPSAHGSAFFSRGLTQALATATIGGPRDALRIDDLYENLDRNFFLHYNFPPYSVGEARGQRAPGRREIGHGMLAQRALEAVIPSQDLFPNTIRLVSDILSSDGSSSMASVCAGCLALMDAGVPILASVAGIAMGLISQDGQEAILTDIVGDEDHLGDMDFKVCGTRKGITALQMDLKVDGLSKETMKTALLQAREARIHILDTIERELACPRKAMAKHAPKSVRLRVRKENIGDIIGPGGANIRALMKETNTQIDIDDEGFVRISANQLKDVEQAQATIIKNTRQLRVNEILTAGIIKIQAPFMRLELAPGIEASLHFNDMAPGQGFVEDRYQAGDTIQVKILGCDERGNLRISNRDI